MKIILVGVTLKQSDCYEHNQPVQLCGRLAEFAMRSTQKLRQQIVKRSDSAVRSSTVGSQVKSASINRYIFSAENAMNLPSDTPGSLIVPDRGSFDVTIVSIEGLKVSLAVEQDLGRDIPEARIKSSLAHLMKRLIYRMSLWRHEAMSSVTEFSIGRRQLDQSTKQDIPTLTKNNFKP